VSEPKAVPHRFGRWSVVGFADARTAKVALCRCDCGQISRVSYETLTSGGFIECIACSPSKRLDPTAKSYASNVASAEGRSARKRHRGEDG
jgi:hypothetical protein